MSKKEREKDWCESYSDVAKEPGFLTWAIIVILFVSAGAVGVLIGMAP